MGRRRKRDGRAGRAASAWARRYGERHNPVRIDVPPEMAVLQHARVYRRNARYYAEVHDPALKKNVRSERVPTLLQAIADALELDRRVIEERSTGKPARLAHEALVTAYLDDLRERAEAGGVTLGTVERYRTALGHYSGFTNVPEVAAAYPHVASVNKGFARHFAAWLESRAISPNGHQNTARRRMRGQKFVLDTVRAMFEWARDPERGNLLPNTFKNPFAPICKRLKADHAGNPVREPDITTAMAVKFTTACDAYQFRLFAPVIMYGLRPSELPFLFREYVSDHFLRVPCNPDLLYTTKGRVSKELPLLEVVRAILLSGVELARRGLLYRRRSLVEGGTAPPMWAASLESLVPEFERRCVVAGRLEKNERLRLRDQLMREAGAITYNDLQTEYNRVARRLDWPKQATIKDFRHHFSTHMENAAMPVFYRKFLMGHSLGRDAVVNYTHLNKLSELYEEAVRREWPDLLDAIENRARELGFIAAGEPREARLRHLSLVKRARSAPGGTP